jgi:hypothetical protein
VAGSLTLGDVIRRFGASLRARRGARMTHAQDTVMRILERCRSPALGGHVYRCDACGAERIAYNSCGNRHCPSCLGHKSAQWLADRAAELLPVPYFHVVFTVPQEIAALALGNKRVVYTILFRAVSETLLTIAADPRHLGAQIGFLAILHTWTQTLLHHPHVHCVVPGGGLSPDGRRWVACRPGFFLPVRVLSQLYRGKFLALLDQERRAKRLQFAGATARLDNDHAWTGFLRSVRRKEWVVYSKRPFGSPAQVLKYLAQYTHRVAISNRRIVEMTDQHVVFRYRDRVHGDRSRLMHLDGAEFLRRFLLHVLPASFVRIRYFGFMANCTRAERIQRCRELLCASDPPWRGSTVLLTSAPLQKSPAPSKVCASCGVGTMLWCSEWLPLADSRCLLASPRIDSS